MTKARPSWTLRAFAALPTVALSAALLAVAAPSQAASAENGQHSPLSAGTATYSAKSTAVRGPIVATAKVGALDITCTLTPSKPFVYYGGPYGGGEEGIATVRCTQPVYAIQVEVALFRYSSQVTYNTHTTYSTTTASADTEYPRMSGEYRTGADAYITWTYGGPTSFIPLTFSEIAYL
ncbi:hypothetical protein GA0070558_12239 [Micromonospora haikouensis]|uniref:Uncharacterized protein n=1 Tax=Micromonospora haikouensis TaxID=686309 RepID=A0A1C4X6D4_9ACTN|nr:hypothetical protein [Micromonospora haikouensis]SCF04026.1 hypothetical protein GA0070558_12239 [Micromonospora haikouensis]